MIHTPHRADQLAPLHHAEAMQNSPRPRTHVYSANCEP
jgi:hypothetical protein